MSTISDYFDLNLRRNPRIRDSSFHNFFPFSFPLLLSSNIYLIDLVLANGPRRIRRLNGFLKITCLFASEEEKEGCHERWEIPFCFSV